MLKASPYRTLGTGATAAAALLTKGQSVAFTRLPVQPATPLWNVSLRGMRLWPGLDMAFA